MPLILAIEPDHRQAARVAALVPARVDAEILVVDSVHAALDVLEARAPDLVLTPMLLSAKDDAALTSRLRALATVGRELQTLVTPVLASGAPAPSPPDKGNRLLTRLRKPKSATASATGCDPAVFAEQVKEYLARIAAEHHDREEARRANTWSGAREAASAPMLTELLTIAEPVTGDDLQSTGFSRQSSVESAVDSLQSTVEPSVPVETAAEVPDEVTEQREIDVEPVVESEELEPVLEASWEDLESFLEDLEREQEQETAAVAQAIALDEPEPDVIELPSPDELWAPLSASQQQAIAPIEGPAMKKRRPAAPKKTPKASRGKGAAVRPERVRKPRQPNAPARPMQDE